MMHRAIGVALTSVLVGSVSLSALAQQSDASFSAAVLNESTAPSYVMITEVDGNTGTERQTCVIANFLLGAIHRENDLAFDRDGSIAAQHIALTTKDHVFTFRKQAALDNIPHYYSQEQLSQVREALMGLTNADLLNASQRGSALGQLGAGHGGIAHNALRDATACVLIERGLSPGMGDITDELWVHV